MTLVALDLSSKRFEDGYFSPSPAANFADAVRCLNENDRRALRKASGVAFANKAGFEAVLGSLAVTLLSEKIDKENVGIFFCGTQAHLATAHECALRAITKGPSLIDPIRFPATVPSYAPTAIAAVYQFHGPALTVGHGEKCHLDAVDIARSFIQESIISQALVIFTSTDRINTPTLSAYSLVKLISLGSFDCTDLGIGIKMVIKYSERIVGASDFKVNPRGLPPSA